MEMNLLKSGMMVGLALGITTYTSMGLPQKAVLAESPSSCDFTTGKQYQHTHRMSSGSFDGGMILKTKRRVGSNNNKVTVLTGKWWVGSDSSSSNNVEIQTNGSSFMMTRRMNTSDGPLTQQWNGTCYSNGYVRGNISDPTIGSGSFSIRY
jgi:hypothetical protein